MTKAFGDSKDLLVSRNKNIWLQNFPVVINVHYDPGREYCCRAPSHMPLAGFFQVQMGAALQAVEVTKRREAQVTLYRQKL